MNIAERLTDLTNDKKRRDFIINTYREWEPVGTVPELHLEFFRLTLPSGHQFIAMEFPINHRIGDRDVLYYDVPKGEPFSPCMITVYQAADALSAARQEMLKGVKC